jgi:uncharacterized protein
LVVSNTSPLVYLAQLGDIALLPKLFSEIVIPRGVYEEISVGGAGFPVAHAIEGASGLWLSVKEITNKGQAGALRQCGLHTGEAEAIVLAGEINASALLMDDRDGIKAAASAGINVIRTLGVYRLAKGRGIISAVRPKLDELRRAGFWVRDEHYRMILESLGE